MGADGIMGSGGSSIELWLSGDDQQVTDVRFQREVWEALRGGVDLAGADLRVEVTNGVAVLDGTVYHDRVKAAAERAARRVEGLSGVESRIEVRSRDSSVIHGHFMHPSL